MTDKKKNNTTAPTFGDLRENYGTGPCANAPLDSSPSTQMFEKSPTVSAKDRPDLTRPTSKGK